jgi:hypothetical protein
MPFPFIGALLHALSNRTIRAFNAWSMRAGSEKRTIHRLLAIECLAAYFLAFDKL